MLEKRKEIELKYHDEQAKQQLQKGDGSWQGDFEGFEPYQLSSYQFFYKLLKENVSGKRVLDYGCGNGVHSAFPIQQGARELVGIDISEQSLKLAEAKIKKERLSEKAKFLQMDCEKLEFPDNSFDVVMDGGTFSSLDLRKAFPEIARVLKPGGMLIGIETLGHNPIGNFNRDRHKKSGKRTEWQVSHIFHMEDFNLGLRYFERVDARFFHLLVYFFVHKRKESVFFKLLQAIEDPFTQLPLIRRYCFKTVFLFQKVKNPPPTRWMMGDL